MVDPVVKVSPELSQHLCIARWGCHRGLSLSGSVVTCLPLPLSLVYVVLEPEPGSGTSGSWEGLVSCTEAGEMEEDDITTSSVW